MQTKFLRNLETLHNDFSNSLRSFKKNTLPNIFIKFLKLNFNSENKTKSFVASVIQPADHAQKLPY